MSVELEEEILDVIRRQLLAAPFELEGEVVEPDVAAEAFALVLNNPERSSGPKPRWVKPFWQRFAGRESEAVHSKEFEPIFDHAAEPNRSVANAVCWLNRAFTKLGLDIEIAGITRRTSVSVTAYQLRSRLPK